MLTPSLSGAAVSFSQQPSGPDHRAQDEMASYVVVDHTWTKRRMTAECHNRGLRCFARLNKDQLISFLNIDADGARIRGEPSSIFAFLFAPTKKRSCAGLHRVLRSALGGGAVLHRLLSCPLTPPTAPREKRVTRDA